MTDTFFPATFVAVARRFIVSACVLLGLCWGVAVLETPLAQAMGGKPTEYPVGMRTIGIWEPRTQTRFDIAVWYPSRSRGSATERDGWIVPSASRSAVANGFFPVVLISHDTAMSRFAHSDLAVALAEKGHIVIAPTHTGDSLFDCSDLYSTMVLYDRPRHLLQALEAVLDRPEFAPHADESRLGVIGVGFGAITATQLAGLVPNPGAIPAYCASNALPDVFCSSWSESMLAALQEDVVVFSSIEGPRAFAPPLHQFAPELEVVPVSPAEAENTKNIAQADRGGPSGKGRSFVASAFAWLGFGDDADMPAQIDDASATGASGPESSGAETSGAAPLPTLASDDAESIRLTIDFQAGLVRGGAIRGDVFVFFPYEDHPLLADVAPLAPPPEVRPAKPVADNRPYRRPASVRALRAVVLISPAGGMLFEQSGQSTIPLLAINPEFNSLYPAASHSQPYSGVFRGASATHTIAGADHFSLFARCGQELLVTLPDGCGRLSGSTRRAADEEKKSLVVQFLAAALGLAQPEPSPSGLKAVRVRGE